ncbi:hypothetical protein OF001_U20283 [Pseudomonas sp. OF001]|uniref:hypothetical protein n=1 Tax=Pseudomonas sp. OF001 TaxID=2772300 RepID=UPI001919CB59|nr:hypothetical protein [Pseudomonas sp. OF001]CAD5377356.1 hypothetical protein OF001_U20283 [Pseudomonas sp. OF001]
MTVLNLTTFDQIRGVLTVSPADLPDSVLASYGLEDDLGADLDAWAAGWSSVVDAGQSRLLRLYAKYFCAGSVARTAQVFVLTKASDGSNEGQRSDADGFLWLSETLLAKAAGFKDQFLEAAGAAASSQRMTFASRVTPARDPITEARS